MSFSVRTRGDWKKITSFLDNIYSENYFRGLKKEAVETTNELKMATPKDSGNTADHWKAVVEVSSKETVVAFENDNVIDGWFNVASALQHGHGTGTGGWVPGKDYINPVVQPAMDDMIDDMWKEVTSK